MKSLFPLICAKDIKASRDFYSSFFQFETLFEIDWYVQLRSRENESIQVALIEADHPSIPEKYRSAPQGMVITVELESADRLYERAKQLGLPVVYELCDEEWGQRHFMTEDPDGLLVDVVQLIQPSPEFLKQHGLLT